MTKMIFRLGLASFILLLLFFIPHIEAVDIVLTHDLVTATCTDIAPGICCISSWPTGANAVKFSYLSAFDIAAVWERRIAQPVYFMPREVRGCSGRVVDSSRGPGQWTWQMWAITRAFGASYITLPEGLPPDGHTVGWMQAEGLLGLAWGGGKWFASDAASRLLGGTGGGGQSFPRRLSRRTIRSEKKGTVYARSPPRFRYPDIIDINGEKYTGGGPTETYRNSVGALVNMTDILD